MMSFPQARGGRIMGSQPITSGHNLLPNYGLTQLSDPARLSRAVGTAAPKPIMGCEPIPF